MLTRFGILAMVAAGGWAQTSARFGEVVPLSGTPADIVLDETRQRLYLVSAPGNRVDVYDYLRKEMLGSIPVGQNPLGAAMSMDAQYLYIANHDSSTMSVINLSAGEFGGVADTVQISARPQGVEVGFDGRVLIATSGTGANNLSSTLLVYDGLQVEGNRVLPVLFPPPPATPPTLQALVARPTTQFNAKLQRTPDGKLIIGVSSITNNTSTVVYIYEVASGTVLQSRTVVGQSTTLSVSPGGSSFMAGFTLYDLQTLNVLSQASTLNAPFVMTGAFNVVANVGGSAFAPDGSKLYSAFNTAAQTNPAPAPQANTLLISDPRSLGISLGINLPESILSKMVITQDGTQIWGLSSSGVVYLPIGRLYEYPILMPETTTVFLNQDDCQPGIAAMAVKIRNIGGGTLTYAVPTVAAAGAALVMRAESGVAPSALTFTMDPGRSAVVRTPGTNLYTGGGANNLGSAVNVTLSSPNAINVPPTIRVFMNYRDSSMRGIVYPVATVPNSTNAAYEGLRDIVVDEARKKVYISNSGYNRLEVFDILTQKFLNPIPVGQLPRDLAMGLDGATLYVATTGGEGVQIVDLDLQQVVGTIAFPAIPRAGNANPAAVLGMANTIGGLQLIVRNPNSAANNPTANLWKVVNNVAIPRTPGTVTGIAANGSQTPITGPTHNMLASPDGSYGMLLAGNGQAYLYDGLADAFTSTSRLFGAPGQQLPGLPGANNTGIFGFYGPLGVAEGGNFLLANGLVTNKALTPIGGAAAPGQLQLTIPIGPGGGGGFPQQTVNSTGLRNISGTATVNENLFVRMSTPVRQNLGAVTNDDVRTILEAVDTKTGATALAGKMPDNPVISVFGNGRQNMPTRQMAVDSQGNVYALTLAGLSVVPLTPANASNNPRVNATRGIVNSADGTTTFKPGSFITISGASLAAPATADAVPPPVVLGGSCVLLNDVAIPLISAAPGQIAAQIPVNVRTGAGVIQVRSLATAQLGARLPITITRP